MSNYSKNIFINCPFDNEYFPLLKAALFTITYLHYEPRISETISSGDVRINNIKKLIAESKFSIHDLSRIISKDKKSLPRFNMPLELGIDMGCKEYLRKDKKFLILEEEKYRFHKVISDISGQDIASHNNEAINVVKEIRNFIYKNSSKKIAIPPSSVIWDIYNDFIYEFEIALKTQRIDPNKIWEMPFSEIIQNMKEWIKNLNYT